MSDFPKRRILIISPVPTHPPVSGNSVRILNFSRVLRENGHDVHFLHIRFTKGDDAAMREFWQNAYHSYEWRNPFTRYKFLGFSFPGRIGRHLAAHGLVSQEIDHHYDDGVDPLINALHKRYNFEVVIVNYVFFSRALLLFSNKVLKLIDTHDVYTDRHHRLRDQGLIPEWFFTTRAEEIKGLKRADRIVAIQEIEAGFFRELLNESCPVHTIGHFLEPVRVRSRFEGPNLLFFGSANTLNKQAIYWFLQEVLPLVRERIPEVKCHIAGGICFEMVPQPNVVIHGWVRTTQDAYELANVVINPILGGTGLKIKTIEALCFGKAQVCSEVAAEGLCTDEMSHLRIATSVEEWRDAIVDLLTDEVSREKMKKAALAYAQAYQEKQRQALEAILAF
jgi:glycosyltransferase involved in cell wall biosynthesis